ncbi:response regulator [Bizionia sediminis]|uniref:Response regulator n=1 Tax=Bizionia sediminis TaxID=1737064 RepID=A0ABW5KS02_9FLAO
MNKSLKVLLVEDDAIEIMKFRRVLEKLGLDHDITQCADGECALKFLKDAQVLPSIILLDLNMPRMDGLDFLKYLKDHSDYKYIPTVILTTSNNKKDMLRCYQLGIAGYILKPLKYEDYENRIAAFFQYWSLNQLVH